MDPSVSLTPQLLFEVTLNEIEWVRASRMCRIKTYPGYFKARFASLKRFFQQFILPILHIHVN